jgi:hypothetical protein
VKGIIMHKVLSIKERYVVRNMSDTVNIENARYLLIFEFLMGETMKVAQVQLTICYGADTDLNEHMENEKNFWQDIFGRC